MKKHFEKSISGVSIMHLDHPLFTRGRGVGDYTSIVHFQITATKETMLEWQNRSQKLVAAYIKKHMNIETKSRNKAEWKGVARLASYEDDKKNGSHSD